MSTIRQERVAAMLFTELSIMVSSELDDPALSLVQVTHVTVSRDLRHAKVFIYNDGDIPRKRVLDRLKGAVPYLRSQLAVRSTMRAVPELIFAYDDTPEKAARIDQLLEQIAEERQETRSTTEEGLMDTYRPSTAVEEPEDFV